jgi:hypothetical protein
MNRIVNIIVDDRVLVLGLDKFYREAMKRFEVHTLLPCAQVVAQDLQVSAARVPVEGYYHESPELRRYFRLMRALQGEPADRAKAIQNKDAFSILKSVASSPIFGPSAQGDSLLPAGRDPMTQTLESIAPERWRIPDLVERSFRIVMDTHDISLVALACRCRDPVPLCALRESTVLYADVVAGLADPVEFQYDWRVTPELQQAAQEFRRVFAELVPNDMPEVIAANAQRFHSASAKNQICGRCVRLGFDPKVTPRKYYHWAIYLKHDHCEVEDFWSEEVWTTERYQEDMRHVRFENRGGSTGWWSKLRGR